MTKSNALVPIAVLIALVAAGCGNPPASSPTAASSASPRRSSPSPSASAAMAVTGFGATDAQWNATHTQDPKYAAGAVYDPDPSVRTGDRYDATIHTGGYVTGYTMNLPAGTGLVAAKAIVLREFPSDASILWFAAQTSCALLEVKSAILGSALGSPTVGDSQGMALVELDTVQSDGTSIYDPKSINEALFGLGDYATAADAPGC